MDAMFPNEIRFELRCLCRGVPPVWRWVLQSSDGLQYYEFGHLQELVRFLDRLALGAKPKGLR